MTSMIKQLTVKLPNEPGTLKGLVATLAGAGVDLKALAVSDRGTDHMEFDHYAECPTQIQEQVTAEAAKAKEHSS